MAEYINKEELIKACDYTVCYEDDEETFGISEARIDLMPTIDIVTCEDCKYRGDGYIHSTKWLPCMAVETITKDE